MYNYATMLKDAFVKFLKLEGLIESFTGYIETRVELLKMEVKEDVSKSLAQVVVILVLIFAATFFMLFISLAIAYRLSELVGMFGGFAIVAGFYSIIFFMLFFFRKNISELVVRKLMEIIKQKGK